MLFETYGDRKNPAVLFFHAMGVTGASSSRRHLHRRRHCCGFRRHRRTSHQSCG